MKKFFFIIAISAILFSCGPSKEEQAKQKRIEDSLLEVERNSALDNANKLLDSLSTPTLDTNKINKK